MDYEAVIGLETHVQLKTKSKMWCGCANEFGAPPNTHVCPVCLGLPGVLPVANEEALRLTVLTGLLLHCSVPAYAKFDRKNYFYPDMPKNYQITQYDQPSTLGGYVEFEFNGGLTRVRITRAHLEEDVGKNFHFERQSGVDFNRAGVPLLEIVSEPDLTSADMAYEYLNALKDILVYGGISDCDMEKGMVRCDVNVSVRPKGHSELGAKIEIKNMNSFSGARRALDYEIPRQIEVLSKGGKLFQSTRRWDDAAGITEEMRTKEHAHDYRYFPEPDLMPFEPTASWLQEVSAAWSNFLWPASSASCAITNCRPPTPRPLSGISPSAPTSKRSSSRRATPRPPPTGSSIICVPRWPSRRAPLPTSGSALGHPRTDRPRGFRQDQLPHCAGRLRRGLCYRCPPTQIVEKKGLAQVSDTGAVERLCDEAIAANPGPAADFKAGKAAALNFLKGQVMKLSKGKANPALAGEILERKLRQS